MTTTNQRAVEEALKLAGLLDGIASGCVADDYRPVISKDELHKWAATIREAITTLRTPGWRPISEGPRLCSAEAPVPLSNATSKRARKGKVKIGPSS